MATFWTRKGDQEDDDEKTAKPFAEYVGHGNMFQPEDKNTANHDTSKAD